MLKVFSIDSAVTDVSPRVSPVSKLSGIYRVGHSDAERSVEVWG